MSEEKLKFKQVYTEYYLKVFGFIYSITNNKLITEDVLQDTFIKVFKNLDTLKNKVGIEVWLNKIAYNTLLDYIKKKTNQELLMDKEDFISQIRYFEIDFHKQLEQRVMSECVNDKINLVPENYRGPLFLDMHDFSNKEIAEILGCTLENAKIRLHRGKKKLKEVIGNQCSFYLDERSVLC